MINYSINLLQTAPQQGFNPILLMVIMGVFFFFMIWPQMRRQKKAKAFIGELQKGDYIVTTGSVHGKIVQISEKTIVIELEEGKMKIDSTGISMELTQTAYPKNVVVKK